MKKFSLTVATFLFSQNTLLANDIQNNLKDDWHVKGNVRIAYISDDNDQNGDAGDEVHDFAVGGSVTLTSPTIDNFQASATLFTSQPLFGQKTDCWLTENSDNGCGSYSFLGEAYVAGLIAKDTSVILGKKVIDTPFANPDDIGMAPNSFEVYLVQNKSIENITFTAGRVTKWAGHDAPERGSFSDLTGGDGASVFAINYSKDILSAQVWYYFLDNLIERTDVGITYADFTFDKELSDKMSISFGGQYAMYKMINGAEDDGTVIGATASVNYDIATVGASFNQADGDFAPNNGFGGGPFYTSSDIMTIATSGKDSSAMKVFAEVEATDQISLSGSYISFDPDKGDSFEEIDLGASYAYNDDLAIDLYLESWTDADDTDWVEYSLFMNYSF